MNQQQHDNMFAAYGAYPVANPNRSPSSGRQGYNTSSLSAGNRINQRQLDSLGHLPPSSLYASEDRFGSYDGAFRNTRMHAPQAFGDSFMMNNNQAWGYNSGAATVNGAMGDGGRLRSSNRRGALPADWTSIPDPAGLGNQALNGPSQQFSSGGGMGPMNPHNGGGGRSNRLYGDNYDTLRSLQPADARVGTDLIPTAIVIKNIPFNYRKEMLTELMSSLHLPQPYAFNYHFDNGIFRGLAFANFQSAEDTYTVIQALNGYDVNGRKLRVEYKKMLPEHERERIEREKREKRGQLEEQHRPMLHQQSSMHSLNSSATNGQRTSPLSTSNRGRVGRPPANLTEGDIDLNEPETLAFYTELTIFANDPDREILVYPTDITPQQRRTVHILAHNLGLEHRSVGEGQNRQLHVIKNTATGVSPTAIQSTMHLNAGSGLSDAHRRGLSRAATIDFADARGGNAHGQYNTIGRGAGKPMLAVPTADSPENAMNLRGVKSFADLRSYTPSPSPSITGYPQANGGLGGNALMNFGEYGLAQNQASSLTTPTTPGGTASSDAQTMLLSSNMASMNLGEGSFAAGQLRPQQNPGAIGSQRPGMNGKSKQPPSQRTVPDRQPLGPNDWPETVGGFGGRGRANGHIQRGSDSSENAVRGATGSSSSRFQ
ncbi:hypothetical protein GQ53DRAFT_374787 [Thozetella sp. PMI_491]|nr:hypothetical protein GQ53DRAFT_374787 [Thozetella sp. PMI_491]